MINYMKNTLIGKIILAAAIVAGSTGCQKFLDTRIDTDLTKDDIENNRTLMWNLANAMYTPMSVGFYTLDGNLFAAATDEAQRTQESGNAYIFNRGTLSQDNISYLYDYSACYEGIRAVNYFLDFAKNGEEILAQNRDLVLDKVNYEKDLRNLQWYRAEAHILRAYYYARLIKAFGGVPIVETIWSGDSGNGQIRQNTYEEVVEYIVRSIDENLDGLQTDWETHPDQVANNDGRFEKISALALKSRVLLYAASPLHNPGNDSKKWEAAAAAAFDVIREMNYTLPQNRDYGSYFVAENSTRDPQSIFLMRRPADNGIERNNYPIATPGGASGITPTQNLVDAYEYIGEPDPADPYVNRDPRLAATIVTNGSTWNGRIIDQSPGGTDDQSRQNASKTGYYLKKFLKDELNLIQGATESHVWVVFRYPEILLNYAEAMNRAYGPDADPEGYGKTARQALEEVRNSASTSLAKIVTTDKGEFEKAVRKERQVELAFEDHRYWDLLRWKEAENVLNEPVRGVVVSKTGDGKFAYSYRDVADRTFNSHNYYMPFPRQEVTNSNGIITQNPGY